MKISDHKTCVSVCVCVTELVNAIQEYRACENSFQCTTFCNNKGFNDRVCKTVTVDESPNIDGTALVNRRVCLCSESSMFISIHFHLKFMLQIILFKIFFFCLYLSLVPILSVFINHFFHSAPYST